MTKTIRFEPGEVPVGPDAGPFSIFHTSKTLSNRIVNQLARSTFVSGYEANVDDDKFTFIVHNSASGIDLTTSLPGPRLIGFSPTSGETGDTITFLGTGFVGTTSILLGGEPATDINVTSNTSMTAKVGNGKTGAVTIITGGGTTSTNFIRGRFTYIAPQVDPDPEDPTPPPLPVNYLGEYYYDRSSAINACGGTAITVVNLYTQGVDSLSLTEALNNQDTVYLDAELTTLPLTGYYKVKTPASSGIKDLGLYFVMDDFGRVTSSDLCDNLNTSTSEGGSGGGIGADDFEQIEEIPT